MPISLLYHDVVAVGDSEASGFPGPGAARYKLAVEQFRAHLDAISQAVTAPPAIDATADGEWMLTFDDGGVSALHPTADLLEERGWRGHFFVTTDYIGRSGFLDAAQLRELCRRGHTIGSHSCSHPRQISACSAHELQH